MRKESSVSEYKAIHGSRGIRYTKDNRLVKKADVPEEELRRLAPRPEPVMPDKQCLFCGEFAKYPRVVNLRTIYLCDNHYYSETLGKIAQRIREIEENAKGQ